MIPCKLSPGIQLAGIFFGTALLMAVYELWKEIFSMGMLTPWGSHAITVVVTAAFATVASFFMRNWAVGVDEQLRVAATAFETMEGMMVTDANSVILRVNRAFTDITGYTAEEAIGKNPRILGSGRHDANFYAAMCESINDAGAWEGEIWNRRKNGEVFPAHLTVTAVKDPNGIVTNYIATFNDITVTHDLHMFNEAILEKSPSGIAVYKASGPCVMANEACAKAIGGTVEEILRQDFRNNAAWKRNGMLDFANQAFETGLTIRRDVEGITTYGKQVVLECIFAPLSISGKPHLLLLTNDVSDRVQAERALTESMRQLEQKELAKTRFLAAAGHDLRQPVAAANLFIDALKFTGPTLRQGEIIKRLDQSMNTFTDLLDALLNVSKLDAGMIKPEYASIKVAEIFNWLEQNFAPMAGEKQLGFRLHFPMKEWLAVRSDNGLVKSVLMNLVSNAVKFTPKGAILISARRRGKSVLFQVWDTGMGIPDEHTEDIFDEFYQINNPQRDRASGLGLGLPIARRALALLGEEIICRSRIGRGSVFGFRLPLESAPGRMAQQPAAEAAQEDAVNESFARGRRFVVVEDDALVSQAMINWLEGMGGEVKCFHSAEDALRHPHIEHADYYIADYMLGGTLNGIQFLNLVRQKLGRPIHAVLVTGDTSAAFIRDAVNCDWPVLHKPINTSRLISGLGAQARGVRKPG